MFRLDVELKGFVHREAIDFRKSINGLSVLVEQSMKLDPFARAMYAFTNRRRDRVKLLLHERTGFWLLLKRLEADRFAWPRTARHHRAECRAASLAARGYRPGGDAQAPRAALRAGLIWRAGVT
jgi:transposase